MQTYTTNSIAELMKFDYFLYMLIKQTYLTWKFTISDFHSFKSNHHKHKGNSHFQDYLPKK